MNEYETSIENKNGEDIQITVEYDTHKAFRGARDSLGVPLEPDEPAGVDIERITDKDGNDVEITDAQEERITEEIEDSLKFDY